MEFHEKLQELRKRKGLTQEELAKILHVSRTAVSKWESGRGWPGIDSLKEIASFFGVTVDELLSGEKLISLAEKEQKERLQKVRSLVSGMADVLAVLLVVLPLYPFRVEERVYSVPLSAYQGITLRHRQIYWCLFLLLTAVGIVRIFLTLGEHFREEKRVMRFSMILGTVSVLLLTASGETYAAALAFLLLLGKGAALFFTSDETAQKTHESDIKDRKQ